MTTTNMRMLLMLSDGRSGLLRLADAERLQVPLLLHCFLHRNITKAILRGLATGRPAPKACSILQHISRSWLGHMAAWWVVRVLPPRGRSTSIIGRLLQGFEEGWTERCYPIQGSAIEANRCTGTTPECTAAVTLDDTLRPTRSELNGMRRRHTASRDLDDSVCKRARYGLIGNAVSVPVARWIGECLAAPCA